MKKPKQPESGTDRIVEILKEMEKDKLRNELQWMKGDGAVSDITASSSGILSLDIALGIGGYPHGRIVEVYGENATGKSTITLQAIAEIQRCGGIAALVDAEFASDMSYSAHLGVDVENLLINQPSCGEQALEVMLSLAGKLTKGDIIVVDSVAALVPQAELDGEMTDHHMGLQARMMGQALRKLMGIAARSGVIVFFTNQTRVKLNVTYGDPTETPGGKALKFASSVRLEVQKKAHIKEGDTIFGNITEIRVVKNKCAPPYRTAKTEIRYGEGVPRSLDVLLLGMSSGVVEKSGAWLTFGGNSLGQGKDKSWQYLKDNLEVLDKLEQAVREKFGLTGR
jgi:recombination protein RecA